MEPVDCLLQLFLKDSPRLSEAPSHSLKQSRETLSREQPGSSRPPTELSVETLPEKLLGRNFQSPGKARKSLGAAQRRSWAGSAGARAGEEPPDVLQGQRPDPEQYPAYSSNPRAAAAQAELIVLRWSVRAGWEGCWSCLFGKPLYPRCVSEPLEDGITGSLSIPQVGTLCFSDFPIVGPSGHQRGPLC